MAACTFTIPFSGSATTLLSKAEAAIQGQGGLFTGNDDSGSFQISVLGSTIRGSYSVEGQSLNIVIDSKPFLLPCGTIESFLRKQLT